MGRRVLVSPFPVIIAASLLAVGRGADASGQDLDRSGPRLILVEQSAITLPETLQVTGAAMSPDGDAIVWSLAARRVFRVSRDSVVPLCPSAIRDPVGAGFNGVSGAVEILDREPRAVWRVRPDGQCETVFSLSGSDEIIAGVVGGGSWYVLLVEQSGRGYVIRADRGEFLRLSRGTQWTFVRDRPIRVFLTGGDQMVVSGMDAPFQWVALAGSQITTGDAQLAAARTQSDGSAGRALVGLRVVPVPPGYLQVIADLTSSDRLIVAHWAPNLSRVTVFEGRLGFLVSTAAPRRLLALRRTNVTQLVVYQWDWASNQTGIGVDARAPAGATP